MGEDALSTGLASTSRWEAADYARVGGFVAELGAAALDLLDPRAHERILDVGCGDGKLSLKIIDRGAEVVGVDSSPELVAAAIFRALRPGGRFAGEMGGEGNLTALREALDEELIIRGHAPPSGSANWYPSADEFAAVYEAAGFVAIDARLIERPTPLEHGIAEWVTTFRKGWLDAAQVPESERPAIAAAVARRFGSATADYVRLRFIMRKPA